MTEPRQLERSILRKLIGPVLAVLALATVAAHAQAQAPAAAPTDGKALFTAKCGVCHANTPTGGPVVGPSLYGVVGRKAGSKEGFHYSKALPATGVTWAPPLIDKFISNPTTFAPGTFMPINVPDAGERKLIVGYLSTLGSEGADAPKATTTTTKKKSSASTKVAAKG
jgi:cytochrome c